MKQGKRQEEQAQLELDQVWICAFFAFMHFRSAWHAPHSCYKAHISEAYTCNPPHTQAERRLKDAKEAAATAQQHTADLSTELQRLRASAEELKAKVDAKQAEIEGAAEAIEQAQQAHVEMQVR